VTTDAQTLRRHVNNALAARVRVTGEKRQALDRAFAAERVMARVFAEPDGPWVLKGGAGMLVRIAGARLSRDLDLLCPDTDTDQALTELAALLSVDPGDRLTMRLDVERARELQGTAQGTTVVVRVNLGSKPYGDVPIDLTTHSHMLSRVEHLQPAPIIDLSHLLPDLPPLPAITLYPLPDQIGDKVAAMYEHHSATGGQSSRFKDLIDLVLIARTCSPEAAPTTASLTAEAARRRITLPERLVSPGESWAGRYPVLARQTSLPAALHGLEASLRQAGRMLDPLLSRTVTTGTWNPDTGTWR
jgi:hypothetical protein